MCQLFGILKTRTILCHPQNDRIIERSFWMLGCCLKTGCRETKREWDELVPLVFMNSHSSELSVCRRDKGRSFESCQERSWPILFFFAGAEPWIEVIETYYITFQHCPGHKHRKAEALSWYTCKKCGRQHGNDLAQDVCIVTRSFIYLRML